MPRHALHSIVADHSKRTLATLYERLRSSVWAARRSPWPAFDDLHIHTGDRLLHPLLERLSLIAAVGIELEQEGIEAEQRRHDHHAAVTVLNVGGLNEGVHQKALGVDENMPLLALDFLSRIIAMRVDAASPFSALLTLWLSMMAAV